MNYVVVRTKLQAILALELLKNGQIKKPFTLIELYQFNVGEDSESVYKFYDLLSKQAKKTLRIIQSNGFWIAVAKLFFACCHAKYSGGRFYVAVIDLYPLAIALKLCRGFNIISFDDGTANIQIRSSSYHSMEPLGGKGIKRSCARCFFPKGASYFNRSRIDQHFTLYSREKNIVSSDKCVVVVLNWLDYFHPLDKLKLPKNIKKIMLGTVYEVPGDTEKTKSLKNIRDDILDCCDLYIPHPREKLSFKSSKILILNSPAESLIEFLIKKDKLTVYHFNSSTVLNLAENEKLKIVDLCKINPRESEYE